MVGRMDDGRLKFLAVEIGKVWIGAEVEHMRRHEKARATMRI